MGRGRDALREQAWPVGGSAMPDKEPERHVGGGARLLVFPGSSSTHGHDSARAEVSTRALEVGSAGPPGQPFRIEDQHALALQTQPAPVGEVGQGLVDGLAGGADELGDLLLGQVVGDP